MSLHAPLSPEALDRLRRQRRRSTVSSLLIAVLVLALFGLLLGLHFLPGLARDANVIVAYHAAPERVDEPEARKIRPQTARKPASPANHAARVIAARMPSAAAVPMPEMDAPEPALEFGEVTDFGSEWGAAAGDGAGAGSMFGSANSIPGALKGRLFDFKQNRRGREIDYDPSVGNYAALAAAAERREFDPAALSRFFMAPNELNLTHLAIPFTPAERGPEFFGAKGSIRPSGWMAVYRGRIAAPETGRYRFRGASDDYMVVLVNGRRNLVACWPTLHETVAGRWRGGAQEGSTRSPLGEARLHTGEWLDLRAGEPVEIAIGIGERPGGMVGFVLEVEREGAAYRRDASGRKILPLFTTQAFRGEERAEIIRQFGSYEFEWEEVPVFGIR